MRRVNSNTIWMWVGIVLLGGIAVLRVQAALAPEEVSASRRERREAAAETVEELEPVLTDRSYEPGECVTWEQTGGWKDTEVVDCEEEHLLEVVGRVDHPATADEPYPTDAQWGLFYEERCSPLVEAYLESGLDPYGTLAAGGIQPTQRSWVEGAHRDVWCGVIAAGPDPTGDARDLPALRGRAVELDQARVYAVGTCLETVAGVVLERPCDQPHHYLVLGELDLSGAETRPGDAEIFARCAEAMGRTQWENDQIVAFFGFEPESWAAGTRRGSCAAAVVDASGTPVLQQPGVLQL